MSLGTYLELRDEDKFQRYQMYHEQYNTNRHDLIIKNVMPEDEGTYTCRVPKYRTYTEEVSQEAELKLDGTIVGVCWFACFKQKLMFL